jgi:opacity protein-like surface antigen
VIKIIFSGQIMNKEIILRCKKSFRAFFEFLLILLFFYEPSPLHSGQGQSLISFSFSFGYFQPKEQAFKELYGNNKFQTSLNLSFALKKNLSVYSGLRYLSCRGETKIAGYEFQEEKYKLSFTIYSIPLGLIYSFSYKKVHPFLGGGVSYNIYKEIWDGLGISFQDKKIGFFLIGGAEYFIWKRFALLGKAQYSSVPTKQGSKLADNINLGGTELSLGFSLHF